MIGVIINIDAQCKLQESLDDRTGRITHKSYHRNLQSHRVDILPLFVLRIAHFFDILAAFLYAY